MDEQQPGASSPMPQFPPLPEPAFAGAAGEGAPAAATMDPVGFWVRGGAFLIDAFVTGILNGAMTAVFVLTGGPGFARTFLGWVLPVAYFTFTVGTWGQSIGKMAAGIYVVQADGSKVGYGRALGRAVAWNVSVVLLGLGLVAAAFTPGKRALHDYLAGTRVVYGAGVGGLRRGLMVCLGVLVCLVPLAVAALAIPKFASLNKRANEGSTKGHLGSLRAGTSIYYGDTEGHYPKALEELVPKYVQSIPRAKTGDHGETGRVTSYGAEACLPAQGPGSSSLDASKLKDTGGWGYVADEKAACAGTIFVDCTHQDSRGTAWHSY